uniref:HTH La-type RNA-binding domain-containing protein n=1 Tax=Caenorhabditis tropicalis TaxID=1561998 RepID=A0A1I7U239_9PELO
MAEKQPMLSFAKVVSGQAEEVSSQQQQTSQKQQNSSSTIEYENNQTEKHSHHQKRDKENAGTRNSDRPRGEGKGKRRNNRKTDRKQKGEAKTEKAVEKPVQEEVKPVEIPVVLEPAPLPATNAWFKNKVPEEVAEVPDNRTVDPPVQPVPAAPKSSNPVPEKKKASETASKPAAQIKEKTRARESKKEPWKSTPTAADASSVTETVVAPQEWPSLAKPELNDNVSPSNSDDNEGASSSQHKTGGKTTKNSWKKVDISVDYGSKGKGVARGGEKGTRRSANDETSRRRSGEEESASGDEQQYW